MLVFLVGIGIKKLIDKVFLNANVVAQQVDTKNPRLEMTVSVCSARMISSHLDSRNLLMLRQLQHLQLELLLARGLNVLQSGQKATLHIRDPLDVRQSLRICQTDSLFVLLRDVEVLFAIAVAFNSVSKHPIGKVVLHDRMHVEVAEFKKNRGFLQLSKVGIHFRLRPIVGGPPSTVYRPG